MGIPEQSLAVNGAVTAPARPTPASASSGPTNTAQRRSAVGQDICNPQSRLVGSKPMVGRMRNLSSPQFDGRSPTSLNRANGYARMIESWSLRNYIICTTPPPQRNLPDALPNRMLRSPWFGSRRPEIRSAGRRRNMSHCDKKGLSAKPRMERRPCDYVNRLRRCDGRLLRPESAAYARSPG